MKREKIGKELQIKSTLLMDILFEGGSQPNDRWSMQAIEALMAELKEVG